ASLLGSAALFAVAGGAVSVRGGVIRRGVVQVLRSLRSFQSLCYKNFFLYVWDAVAVDINLLLLNLNLQVEQEAYGFLADSVQHGLKQVIAFTLVLNEWVTLRHGTQADSLLEVIHLVQVLAPLAVHHGHEDPAF